MQVERTEIPILLTCIQGLPLTCDEALFSEKRGFQRKRGRHSVSEGFGKDLYRKGK